ncbi:MAG TPA: TetR/AcrR family transcriptional regulator [Candidatus Marinimicrobia bacterium]|jgi:AcrR family transcriptional regulator|nr:TetR/AcrR family transcriptional regulator [Candidatus Neomarinimicrobiota bacterium]|tara:strand:+ start:3529 stop:4125 length:597 start_codon:yes stop_codon:yes gene_type:complete
MSRKIQRKEQILDAALHVIVQNGYHQSRMDDIVSTSGLSKGAIYWYYKSKKDMYLDLVNHWVIRYSNSLLKLPQEDISSGEQLKNLFETFFDQFEKDPIVFKALLEFWSLAGRDKDFKIKLEKVTQNFIHYIESIIKKGVESGEFKQVNPNIAAMSIMVVIEGISWFTLFEKNSVSAKEYTDTVFEFILSGLLKRIES